MSGPQTTQETSSTDSFKNAQAFQAPAPAQTQVTAQQMAQQQEIMQSATKKINDTIQKTPGLENHKVSIIFENDKLVLKVSTTDGSDINKKVAPGAIRNAVLGLSGEEFAVAGLALQTEKADSKELAEVLKNDISQQAIRNLINRSSLTFEERRSEGSKGGDGTKSVEATVSGYKREQRLAEEKRLRDMLIQGTYLTEQKNKEEVKEVHSKKEGTFSTKGAIYAATIQGEKGAVKVYHDEIIQEDLIKKQKEFNQKFDTLSEYNNEKFYFEKDEKEEKIYVTMVHHDGNSKKEVFYDENGLNPQTLLNLYEVANIYTKHKDSNMQKKYDKIRNANNLDIDKATKIRDLITKMVFSNEDVKKTFEQANEKYQKDNPGYHLSKHGFAAAYLNEVLKKEEENRKNIPDESLERIILDSIETEASAPSETTTASLQDKFEPASWDIIKDKSNSVIEMIIEMHENKEIEEDSNEFLKNLKYDKDKEKYYYEETFIQKIKEDQEKETSDKSQKQESQTQTQEQESQTQTTQTQRADERAKLKEQFDEDSWELIMNESPQVIQSIIDQHNAINEEIKRRVSEGENKNKVTFEIANEINKLEDVSQEFKDYVKNIGRDNDGKYYFEEQFIKKKKEEQKETEEDQKAMKNLLDENREASTSPEAST